MAFSQQMAQRTVNNSNTRTALLKTSPSPSAPGRAAPGVPPISPTRSLGAEMKKSPV
eukprot:gene16603-22703_t